MRDRCPRCAAPLIRNREERLCLLCGTLTNPQDRERAMAGIAAESAFYASRPRRRKDPPRTPDADPDAIASVIDEFGDLPLDVWDRATSVPSWHHSAWVKLLAAARKALNEEAQP